jgi:hypothetical protein
MDNKELQDIFGYTDNSSRFTGEDRMLYHFKL